MMNNLRWPIVCFCLALVGCKDMAEPEFGLKTQSETKPGATNYADPMGKSIGSRLGRDEIESEGMAPQGTISFPFGDTQTDVDYKNK